MSALVSSTFYAHVSMQNRLCVDVCLHPVHAVAKEDVQWAFDLMKEAVMEL